MTLYQERAARIAAVQYTAETHNEVVDLLLARGYSDLIVRYDDTQQPWIEAKKPDGSDGLTFNRGMFLVQHLVYDSSTFPTWRESGTLKLLSCNEFRDRYERAAE